MRTVDLLKSYFATSFEPNEGGYLYREKGVRQAYQFSRIEHSEFIEVYGRAAKRAIYWLWAVIISGAAISIALAAFVWPASANQIPWMVNPLFIAFGLVAYFVVIKRATKRISAVLEGRPPIYAALSNEAVRRRRFSKITYRNLAMVPLLSAILLFSRPHAYDPMHGWGRLIWLPIVGLNLLAVIQAIRKYRIVQADRP